MVNILTRLASRMNFGAKTARRHTVDIAYRDMEMPNPDRGDTLKLKDYISSDPDLAAAMRKFVDNVLIEMPTIIKSSKSTLADSTIEGYNEQLKDVRFYRKLRNAVYSLLFSGNAYLEIKFSGKKLRELYNIDPDTINITVNDAGEPVKYTQRIKGHPPVEFMPEEIIHLTIDHLETSEWGMAFLKPLKSALYRKQVAESYLEWLVANNKFAPLIKTKTIDTMQIDEMARVRADIETTTMDPNRLPFLNFGPDEDLETMRIFTTEDFNTIIAYIEKQKDAIITLLQIPPIIAGTVDNSNRSNSEIQARYVFYNTIHAFQNLIAEELNFEMIKNKLNWRGAEIQFSEMDKGTEADLLKIAKTMKQDLNFSEDAIEEYLRQNGFKLPKVDKLFEEIILDEPTNASGENSNESPSREPRSKRGIPENEEKRLEDRQMGVSNNAN